MVSNAISADSGVQASLILFLLFIAFGNLDIVVKNIVVGQYFN